MNSRPLHRGRSWSFNTLAVVALMLAFLSPILFAQDFQDLAGKPVVGKNTDGQLELFEVDGSGQLRQRYQKKSNGDWSAWATLGGSFLPGIAVGNDADGRLKVFAVDQTNHALKCICQCATNDSEWSEWLDLGGQIQPPLAVAPNADGRLEVFAAALNSGAAGHLWQTGSNGIWSSWSDLGGAVQPGMVAARNADGRIELFALAASDGSLMHRSQLKTNTTSEWLDWESLGGDIAPGFVVGTDRGGRFELFGVNRTNGETLRICEAEPASSSQWTSWRSFGGDMKPELAIAKCAYGRLEILGVNATNLMLMHCWEVYTNDSDVWSGWADLGEKSGKGPVVLPNEDGDMEVFAVDPADPDVIHHRRQFGSSNDWLDWSSLEHHTFPYRSRTWQSDEGLPDNLVQAITQTADGFLWVGTRSGLARFDGNQFLVYDSRNTPALKNSSITALCAGRDGSLWIGTDGGGVVRLRNGIFEAFGKTNGLAGDAVQVIFESRDETLWIGTTTGMSRWKGGGFHNYTVKDGLSSDVVRCIYEDRDSNLWIATGKGLNRLSPGGVMDTYAMPNGLPNDSVRAICQDRGGRIWIGSNNGLLWYEKYWKIAFFAYNTKYGLSDTFVSAICEDADGNLWAGTYSGLNRFREGRFYNQPDGDGQSFDKVNALFVDSQGNLWVGSKEGLSRLTREEFFTYTKQQGLTHNNIMATLQDKSGNIWIGTWGGGVDKLQNERVTAYASTNGLSQDLILSLCAGLDGSLWAGADFDGGLMCLRDGHMTHFALPDGLSSAGVRVLHEDQSGNLWAGTDHGIMCFSDGRFVTNHVTARLAGVAVRDICAGPGGVLWFATIDGLYYSKGRQLTSFTRSDGIQDNSLTALFLDEDDTLWIGTGGSGLIRYRNGAFSNYSRRHGLFSDEIFGIAEDDKGWLWMTCSKGVFRVRKSDFDLLDQGNLQNVSSLVYGKNDGMKSPQCNGSGKPSLWKSGDGRLWFPTSKGLAVVDPNTIEFDGKPPTVFIETVVADATTVENGRTSLAGATFVLGMRTEPLRIRPGHGELEFQYIALDYTAPEKVQYKYRLVGVDPGWVEAGGRHTAYYTYLAPGTYQFEVRACNKDGVWSQSAASIEVILRPHYWQTVWFRGALALAVVGGASGLARYGTRRRMQRQLAVLEREQAVEKERGRIAKDMHDQIGAGLTQIGLLGEFTRRDAERDGNARINAEKICGLARELAQTVDEIVWTVNPRNDTLNKLGAYLAAYAEDFFQGTSIRCRLEIPPGLPAYPVSAELRHNLFLIVKEALNNIAKHSRATEARLRLAIGGHRLELAIEDNGVGFTAAAGPSRNGLLNMKERVTEIGGRVEISSEPQKGTRIFLSVPVEMKKEAEMP